MQDKEPNDEFARGCRRKERLLLLAEAVALKTNDKDREYGGSWKRRGGTGAFFVICRKWDRIEEVCRRECDINGNPIRQYDLFQRFEIDRRDEGILDDVRDLIGYLFVLLEEMMERGYVKDTISEMRKKELDPTGRDGPTDESYRPIQPKPRHGKVRAVPLGSSAESQSAPNHAAFVGPNIMPDWGQLKIGELYVFADGVIARVENIATDEDEGTSVLFYSPKFYHSKTGRRGYGRVDHPAPFGYQAEEEGEKS